MKKNIVKIEQINFLTEGHYCTTVDMGKNKVNGAEITFAKGGRWTPTIENNGWKIIPEK